MIEITNRKWEEAHKRLLYLIRYYYLMNYDAKCEKAKSLFEKYEDGDRSTELYNAIMEL